MGTVGRKRILVVEDDPHLQAIMVRLLTKAGLDAVAADRGDRAFSILEQQSFNVLLLDQGLPDMTGVELLRRLRASKMRTPALMVTGDTSALEPESLCELGVVEIFSKPVDLHQLLEGIARACSQGPGAVPE